MNFLLSSCRESTTLKCKRKKQFGGIFEVSFWQHLPRRWEVKGKENGPLHLDSNWTAALAGVGDDGGFKRKERRKKKKTETKTKETTAETEDDPDRGTSCRKALAAAEATTKVVWRRRWRRRPWPPLTFRLHTPYTHPEYCVRVRALFFCLLLLSF